jgi:hypothetical protein
MMLRRSHVCLLPGQGYRHPASAFFGGKLCAGRVKGDDSIGGCLLCLSQEVS